MIIACSRRYRRKDKHMPHRWPALRTLLPILILAMAPTLAAAPEVFRPALVADFPDPFVMRQAGYYLAYATNPASGGVNVQIARSTDLLGWQLLRDGRKLHDAMPIL